MPKETVKHNSEMKTVTSLPKTSKRLVKFASYLIILLLFVIIIIAAYYFLLDRKRHNENLEALQQQVSSNQERITALQEHLQNLDVGQAQLIRQIQNHGFTNIPSILSNVVYLLQQAQLKLTVEHDVVTAIILLNTVEQRISSLHNQSLQPLSLAIKKDLNTLNAVNKIDFGNLSKQFTLLNKRISDLSLDIMERKSELSTTIDHKKGWREALTSSLQKLRGIVVVHHTDRKFTPLLQQQQLVNFKQYLQDLAQQAFWGALNNNAIFYHQRLLAIRQSLQRYILPINDNAKLIQQQIISLQGIRVASKLPSELSALSVAKRIQAKKIVTMQGNYK